MQLKRTTISLNDYIYNVVIQRFDNFYEYYSYILDNCNEDFNNFCDELEVEPSTIKNYMLNGSNKNLNSVRENIRISQKRFTLGNRQITQTKNSFVGNRPNISAFLNNEPNNMYRNYTDFKKQKIISVYFEVSVAYFVSEKEFQEKQEKLLSKCLALEHKGYRVKINFVISSCETYPNRKLVVCCFPLKKENKIMNIRKIIYPLTDVISFRTAGFAYLSYTQNRYFGEAFDGLGHPIYNDEHLTLEVMKKIKEKNEKCYYINFNTNIDNIFNDI